MLLTKKKGVGHILVTDLHRNKMFPYKIQSLGMKYVEIYAFLTLPFLATKAVKSSDFFLRVRNNT